MAGKTEYNQVIVRTSTQLGKKIKKWAKKDELTKAAWVRQTLKKEIARLEKRSNKQDSTDSVVASPLE